MSVAKTLFSHAVKIHNINLFGNTNRSLLQAVESSSYNFSNFSRCFSQLTNPKSSPLESSVPKKKQKSVVPKTQPYTLNNSPTTPISSVKRPSISDLFNLPKDTTQEFVKSEWHTVYRFPHIRAARVVQKLKLYQTAFTCCIAMPATFGLVAHGLADESLFAVTTAACGLACGMLYVMGNFASRLIGVIYVFKEDTDIVRVAHLTFFGNRRDEIFKKTDFIPFSELPDNLQEAYVHIKTYSDPEKTLYLSIKYGQVHDFPQFEEIFGSTPELIVKKVSKKPDEKK